MAGIIINCLKEAQIDFCFVCWFLEVEVLRISFLQDCLQRPREPFPANLLLLVFPRSDLWALSQQNKWFPVPSGQLAFMTGISLIAYASVGPGMIPSGHYPKPCQKGLASSLVSHLVIQQIYLLRINCVPGTLVGAEDKAVNKLHLPSWNLESSEEDRQ